MAFVHNDGMQCGFCTPGFVVSVRAFLDKNPKATEQEIRAGLNSNLCRCGTYANVIQAALEVVKGGHVAKAKYNWPKRGTASLIGKQQDRVDGLAKATGAAKYSYDINPPNVLLARALGCPTRTARSSRWTSRPLRKSRASSRSRR